VKRSWNKTSNNKYLWENRRKSKLKMFESINKKKLAIKTKLNSLHPWNEMHQTTLANRMNGCAQMPNELEKTLFVLVSNCTWLHFLLFSFRYSESRIVSCMFCLRGKRYPLLAIGCHGFAWNFDTTTSGWPLQLVMSIASCPPLSNYSSD